MRLAWQVFVVCTMALSFCSCAGYRLGPNTGVVPGSKTIQVRPFTNHTLEPHLTDALTTALRKQIQRDGTYKLDTTDQADVILTGTIIDYSRAELSYQPTDAVSVLDYRLTMKVHVVATECATGKVILDKDVQAATVVRVSADLARTEHQALPLLAETMAKTITDLLVDGDWGNNLPPAD